MNIYIQNPPTKNLERTFLSRSIAAEETDFPVKNADRFKVGAKVLVGEMGNERSEILTVTAISPKQLTLSESEFPHDADDPVYLMEVDKVRIYRSTSKTGSYTLLDTVDIDVDNNSKRTVYNDPDALSTYWYQLTFYDSVGDAETERTPAIAATGFDPLEVGTIISEVALEVNDPDFMEMSIAQYMSFINSINDDLITQAKRPFRFLKTNVSLDIEANASRIDLPNDLWSINYLEVNELGPASSRTYRPKKVSATEARFQLTQQTAPGDYVNEVAYDDEENQIIVVPKARTERLGAFSLHYYKKFDRITTLADKVEVPNTLIYKHGLKREFYTMKADDDNKYVSKVGNYDKLYQTEVMKLSRQKNIEAGGPMSMAPDRKRYPQWGGRKYRQ